jgi:hypothetical protein
MLRFQLSMPQIMHPDHPPLHVKPSPSRPKRSIPSTLHVPPPTGVSSLRNFGEIKTFSEEVFSHLGPLEQRAIYQEMQARQVEWDACPVLRGQSGLRY